MISGSWSAMRTCPAICLRTASLTTALGSIKDLNDLVDTSLGWTIDAAMAVNDRGQIAAMPAHQQYGVWHTVLLTPEPEPEPSTLWLLVAGGLAFLAIKGRRFLNRIRGLG